MNCRTYMVPSSDPQPLEWTLLPSQPPNTLLSMSASRVALLLSISLILPSTSVRLLKNLLMEGNDVFYIIYYKKMISHSECSQKGRMLDAWPVRISFQQLQSSEDYCQVSVLVEVACVKIYKTYDIFNAYVTFTVVVQFTISKALVLEVLCIGASVDLFLPIFVCFGEQLRQISLSPTSLLVLEGIELLRGKGKQKAQLISHHPHSILTDFRFQILPLFIGWIGSQLHPSLSHPIIKLNLKAKLLSDLHSLLFIVINRIDLYLKLILGQRLILIVYSSHWYLVLCISGLYSLLILSLLPLGLLDLLLYSFQLSVNHSQTRRTVSLTLLSLLNQGDREKAILLAISAGWSPVQFLLSAQHRWRWLIEVGLEIIFGRSCLLITSQMIFICVKLTI